MADVIQKTFEETIKTALRTERVHGFRLCVGEKDNVSVAKGGPFGTFVGYDNPICPSDTKTILDVVVTPDATQMIWSRLLQLKKEQR